MKPIPLKVIFFDLGDTLVHPTTSSPTGVRFDWVPGAANLIDQLQQIDIRLGVLSNTGTMSRTQLFQMLPHDFPFELFDENLILLSSEVGWEKPDPRIFRLAVNRAQKDSNPEIAMQIDPQECLFVGESLKEVITAQQVGMMGTRVQTGAQSDLEAVYDVLAQCGLLG